MASPSAPEANKKVALKANAHSSKNDLNLFEQKKYQVLTLTPPETLNNTLIADASPAATETDNVGTTGKQNGKIIISGGVSVWDGDFDVDRIVNHLLETHFENSKEGKKLDEQVKHHSGLGHRAIAVAKDGLYETFQYQGIEPSMRGGKLVLDSPDFKVRNKAWADYVRQRYIDKIHAQVVTSLMQIAEGIGNSESERGTKAIATGKDELCALVGEEEADRAVKALTQWLNSANVPYANFAQTPWNTMERTKKLEEILTAAIKHDQVIIAITKRVEKYAHPGEFQHRSSQIIQTTLNGVALLDPFYISSLVAACMEVGYKLGTGGSEENKLERELLFDKRIQSRLKVLTQEASLALDNYRYALITKNPPLLAFSQEVVQNLTGNPKTCNFISAQDRDAANSFIPEMKESGQDQNQGGKTFSAVRYIVKSTNGLIN